MLTSDNSPDELAKTEDRLKALEDAVKKQAETKDSFNLNSHIIGILGFGA